VLSLIARLMRASSLVVAPGYSRVRGVPAYVTLSFLAVTSVALMILPPWLLVPLLSVLCVLALWVRGLRVLIATALLFITFVAPFIALSIGAQLVVGSFSPITTLMGVARMAGLMLLGSVVFGLINIHELALLLRRVSHDLAVSTALAIKFFYLASVNLSRLAEVYSVNLRAEGFMGKVRRLTALSRALTYVCTVSALESMEALYTRPNVLLGGVRSEERGRGEGGARPTA